MTKISEIKQQHAKTGKWGQHDVEEVKFLQEKLNEARTTAKAEDTAQRVAAAKKSVDALKEEAESQAYEA